MNRKERTHPMPSPSEHREKAVEAVAKYLRQVAQLPGSRKPEEAEPIAIMALQAAEPQLQRMFFERFREAALRLESRRAAERASSQRMPAASYMAALQAAIDKAQELLEGDKDD